MPAYIPALLLPIFAAGAYFCLRFAVKQRKRLLGAFGALLFIFALLSRSRQKSRKPYATPCRWGNSQRLVQMLV